MSTIPAQAIELIKKWEGFRAKPYLCSASVATIGYGTTVYPDTKKPVTLQDPPISVETASKYLHQYLASPCQEIQSLVKRPLSSGELSALLSFVYNLGLKAFKTSTLLRVINGQMGSIEAEWLKWCRAGGNVSPGLQARRKEEYALFASSASKSPDLLPTGPTEDEIRKKLQEVEKKS